MDEMQKHLLKEVAALDALPVGAYNIRSNGKSAARNTTAEIDIVTKEDKQGIDVIIKPGTKNKSVHIPVIHDGVHSFFVKKNSRVKYIEKHYGEGTGRGKRLMNPSTVVELGENSTMEMETSQIGGIDDTVRITRAKLEENASLIVHDKILTEGDQKAKAELAVQLNGDGSTCDMISRGVARGQSRQEVVISIDGNAACSGHAECDSIIMEKGVIVATPRLTATNVDAALIHEAAIGKIAGEQLTKLMTMGLDEKEAEEMIIRGFLQ